jgi:hypothetical protein
VRSIPPAVKKLLSQPTAYGLRSVDDAVFYLLMANQCGVDIVAITPDEIISRYPVETFREEFD